jgi:hypothetical protein
LAEAGHFGAASKAIAPLAYAPETRLEALAAALPCRDAETVARLTQSALAAWRLARDARP